MSIDKGNYFHMHVNVKNSIDNDAFYQYNKKWLIEIFRIDFLSHGHFYDVNIFKY